MLMLSELLRFEIIDKNQQTARPDDISVALLDEEYPAAANLFFYREKTLMALDWQAVEEIDAHHKRITVTDLDAAAESSYFDVKGNILLRHDLLDALILDLLNRRTTRASDLLLEEEDSRLRLRAADTGFGAMLRRISRGLYRHINQDTLYDWKYVEFLRGDPRAVDNGAGYHLRINRLSAGEIAQLANYLPYLHAAELLTLLPDPKAADVFEAMPIERQVQIFEEFDEDEAGELLALMSPDLAADLIGHLPTAEMKRFLERLPAVKRQRILELLRYPSDTVGGVMVNDFVSVCAELTVGRAREELRSELAEPDFVELIFLIRDRRECCLCGSITLRQLLTEDDDRVLEEIMDRFVETLDPQAPARAAAYRIIGGQLSGMPVTDENGKLVGVMTIDAAIAQIVPPTSDIKGIRIFS